MSNTAEQNKSGICWGKVLVGAAVTAGAIAVLVVDPAVGEKLISGAKDIASAIYSAIGSAASWFAEKAVEGVKLASKHQTITIASAATAGAFVAMCGTRSHASVEQLRRAEDRMLAQMQAAGYQPALIAARTRG